MAREALPVALELMFGNEKTRGSGGITGLSRRHVTRRGGRRLYFCYSSLLQADRRDRRPLVLARSGLPLEL